MRPTIKGKTHINRELLVDGEDESRAETYHKDHLNKVAVDVVYHLDRERCIVHSLVPLPSVTQPRKPET